MKKWVFSLFLVLALLLAALAGCGQDGGSSKASGDGGGEDVEQLLGKGCYEVYDEDGELVGYLEVKSSKITVYDERGSEEDTLRYDYSAKKERYTLDDGELFGSGEFTVEKNKRTLKLITEDDEEYTLEEIDKDDLPVGGKTPAPAGDGGYIELPAGCYAAYDGRSLVGYLKVTGSTMIFYGSEGDLEGEVLYSYERDGSCTALYGVTELTYWFTYERGEYHMSGTGSYRLEPIRESEIPEYSGSSGDTSEAAPAGNTSGVPSEYYIGGNGYLDLYAYLPEPLYDGLERIEYLGESFVASGTYHDPDNDLGLNFYARLASGDDLEDIIEDAYEAYEENGDLFGPVSGREDLLYGFLRYSLLSALEENYLGGEYLGEDFYYDYYEDVITVSGRDWRYLEIYVALEDGGGATLTRLFWMEDGNCAIVGAGGYGMDPDSSYEVYNMISYIDDSLELYP